MENLTPKAIVAALDEHIIGQKEAKRAVAVALRNRWRRQRLDPDLRDEVTPKNILMIGPTGCGKTEISRRLAKLAEAPFVKVEATKFTEVGYVGRDVDQIARDLAEEAIRLEKDRRREAVRETASKAAMDRLLTALVGDFASDQDPGDSPGITERSDGSLLVSGSLSADVLADRIGIEYGDDREFGTAAGYALHVLKRLPGEGDYFTDQSWRFEVIDMDGRRIDKLLVSSDASEV